MGVATKVTRWGTSLGVRLPAAFAKSMSVSAGDMLDMTIDGDQVVLRRLHQPLTLRDLRDRWDGEPYVLTKADREWLDVPARGAEAW